MLNNIDLLKPAAIFVAVVNEGSFRGAARVLHLSPSVVSQAVSTLEAQLGTQLLYRSIRKLTLTHAGKVYFQELVGALERIEGATQEAQGNSNNPVGRLRISAPTAIASSTFAGYIGSTFAGYIGLYRKQCPGVELEIDLSDELRDPIEEHYDLLLRISDLDTPAKGAQLMFQTTGILCASPRFFRQMSAPMDLKNLCWLRPPTLTSDLLLYPRLDGRSERITPAKSIAVNSGQLIRELLDKGIGFAVFPDFAVLQALEQGDLLNILPGWDAGQRGFFAIHSASNAKLSIARDFVKGWRKHIAETCGAKLTTR